MIFDEHEMFTWERITFEKLICFGLKKLIVKKLFENVYGNYEHPKIFWSEIY